ncbi:DUF4468 domain-containing protein [Chryseobacterium vrystaatense]|uniref:DUF4468 domain-containing protein n=1 Tax=Chryseobacterium vrystaatense TaxID=307480 RepID=A0ABR4UJ55_9FLAO|nr:DUF4468 domain-containing protein [Chryseobacterium vrystaatense]KFF24772.1 hypothetical protein IW16_17710 [Chryseobacterium vrystaatense]
MKIYLLFFILLFVTALKAQDKTFNITDEGLAKYVVTDIPGISKEEAYKKVIDWVNRKFNTPQKAIKGMIENQYIRIEAVSESAMRYSGIGGSVYLPIKYEIEISLKDNKYKFEIISLQEKNYLYPQLSSTEFIELNLAKTDGANGYNRVRKTNGEFRNKYKYASELADYFNSINEKLKIFLLGSDNPADNW